MPTVASSNTTLTLAALAFRSVRNILERFTRDQVGARVGESEARGDGPAVTP
jgi:choline dehydrogenase-like flavoprotein